MSEVTCPHCGTPIETDGAAPGQAPSCPVCAGEPPVDERESRGTRLAIYGLLGLVGLLVAAIGVVLALWVGREPAGQDEEPSRPATLEGWIDRLEHGPDKDARREAAVEIVGRGPQAVLEALRATTKIPDDGQTLAISDSVVEAMASTGSDAVAALGEGLSSGKPNVRAAAARVLREIGAAARDAVGPLTQSLGDEVPWVRWFAADALGNIGPDAAAAVDALLPLIEHEDRHTRHSAIVALGKIGPAAKAAAPRLAQVQQEDQYQAVRKAAAVALHQVNLEALANEAAAQASEEVRRLIKKLIEGDEFQSVAAAKQLGRLGTQAAGAIPALTQTLAHEQKWRRVSAAEALGAMGRRASSVTPTLEKLLEDEDPDVRAAAEEALERIGGRPREL